MEKLAYIGKIIEINPIEGADRIASATAICGSGGKWCGVIKKDEFQIDSLAEVILQDSIVPSEPRFSFLEKNKYRVKMAKFRGVPSECLIMPLTIQGEIGKDITSDLKIIKYVKEIPAHIGGETLGSFPGFIPRTDEPNFQSVPHLVNALREQPFYASVKMDGTSTTAYNYKGHFGICSRNWEKKEDTNNALWKIAKKYEISKWLPDGVAIQWETIGPGIQKNPVGVKELEPRMFDVYFINEHRYGSLTELVQISKIGNFPMVPVVETGKSFNMTDEELRTYAEGQYESGRQREGVVIRTLIETRVNGERVSFKVINLSYKD